MDECEPVHIQGVNQIDPVICCMVKTFGFIKVFSAVADKGNDQ